MKDFLQGKWLKHPLHPPLVHIPTALWPAAAVLDILSLLGYGGNAIVQTSFLLPCQQEPFTTITWNAPGTVPVLTYVRGRSSRGLQK